MIPVAKQKGCSIDWDLGENGGVDTQMHLKQSSTTSESF